VKKKMSKRLDAQRHALQEAERIARHLEKMSRVAQIPPPPVARPGRLSANGVQPRPMREAKATAPSKPDTWTGGTVDPPPQTKAERKVKDWAGGKTAKRSTKARRLAGTPISNIAGSKRDAERVQALDRQRQKEVTAALIAEARANPKPKPKTNTGATTPIRPTKTKQKVPKKKPGTDWEGKKSSDILDSWARLVGSAFSGKRSR
jgi:hypothetical protein